VRRKLEAFLVETQADELIITSNPYEHEARLRSYEIVAEIANEAGAEAQKLQLTGVES
jgi:hypothetical protein